MMSGSDIEAFLFNLVGDVDRDPAMQSKTGIQALDRALVQHCGDARLGRVALMTPQEIMAIGEPGEALLEQAIARLSDHRLLTIPELICGRGKARLQQGSEMPGWVLDLASGLPGWRTG